MQNKVFIKEIFESIQGEGPFIGVNQLFIRFTKCNLHCKYCDTDFISNSKEYSLLELLQEVNKHKNIHSISLTGGEPLTEANFLKEFLPNVNNLVYLETNGTLFDELTKIIKFVNIISMDVKLQSSSNNKELFEIHKKFIENALKYSCDIFLKVVFDEKITKEEIEHTVNLAKSNNLLIVLQPKTDENILKLKTEFINKTFFDFVNLYSNVRLIPQVHKFLNIK